MIKKNVINQIVKDYNFKNLKLYDDLNIHGYYCKNIQVVYVRKITLNEMPTVEHIYFSVDILKENLVIGYQVKNYKIKDGVSKSISISIPLSSYTYENIDNAFSRLGIKK